MLLIVALDGAAATMLSLPATFRTFVVYFPGCNQECYSSRGDHGSVLLAEARCERLVVGENGK